MTNTGSIITAQLANNRVTREKTNAQLFNGGGVVHLERTSRDLKPNTTDKTPNGGAMTNLPLTTAAPLNVTRKESSFYANQKENNNSSTLVTNNFIGNSITNNNSSSIGNGGTNVINLSSLKDKLSLHNQQTSTSSHVDANSIINSFYANNSTISTVSQQQQQKLKSSTNPNRTVLSSKQLNNQIQIINHLNNMKRDDCLTSAGESYRRIFLLVVVVVEFHIHIS